MNIYICRHGEYQNPHNVMPYRLPGFPLTEKGRIQAKKLGQTLQDKNIQTIYASPIERCRETASIINESVQAPLHISHNLVETFSPFQGMDIEQFKKDRLGYINNARFISQGGERIEHQFERMNKLVKRILTHYPEDSSFLLVSHGDPILSLIGGLVHHNLSPQFLAAVPYVQMGGLIRLQFKDQKLVQFVTLIPDGASLP